MILYALLGIATEVCFTAFKNLYYYNDWSLDGHTQLWIIPVYAVGGYLFEIIYIKIPYFYIRIPIYLIFLYFIEYISGILLINILGYCPWEYTDPGNIHGLVQLYYIPFWTIFVIGVDILFSRKKLILMNFMYCKNTTL